MDENIRYCIRDKTEKIESVKSKYGVWWLALVDHIGYSLDEFERELFKEQISIEHNWNKILIINPLDHNSFFEL